MDYERARDEMAKKNLPNGGAPNQILKALGLNNSELTKYAGNAGDASINYVDFVTHEGAKFMAATATNIGQPHITNHDRDLMELQANAKRRADAENFWVEDKSSKILSKSNKD